MTMRKEMVSRIASVFAAGLACAVFSAAAQIQGTVLIERKLTHRKVTMPVGSYERGITVRSGSTADEDPLAFERTHVVVYLEGDLPAKAAGAEPMATMEQKNKQFVPDLLAIPAGATISFPNLDPIFHNVFSLSKPKEFDLGNYPKDKTRLVTFPKPGIVFVNCHLHPNMTASIVVCPNSFYTKPDADGNFTLSDVPPGTYKVMAWHKTAGLYRQTITVTAHQTATVRFNIPLPANP